MATSRATRSTVGHRIRCRRVFLGRLGRLAALMAASTAAVALAGCLGEGRAEDTMTIANRTGEPITVVL